MISRRLVIIGAGPAGLSAAVTAAKAGLPVTIIDENPRIGGQVYQQRPESFGISTDGRDDPAARRGETLLRSFDEFKDKIELLSDTTVWGLFPPKLVATVCEGEVRMIEAEQLVIAPGAYEYVPPFPGWTLPGVMTPGGAQSLVKTMKVLPGRRVLIAGTGPFLLVVALQLHRAGMDVAGVVEAVRTSEVVAVLPRLLASPDIVAQGWRYLRALKQARIPMYRGSVIVEARGEDEVREATIAPCDHDWNPDRSRTTTFAVDTLCVGYGFIPRAELAHLAGCAMRFDNGRGGWIPDVDGDLQTSVPGLWAPGDGGGVAGALVAELEGALVGLNVAHRLGALDPRSFRGRRKKIVSALKKSLRFRSGVDRVCAVRPGLTKLAASQTLACRCEETPCAELEEAVRCGGTNIRTLKTMTRLGMGPCQGRFCWPAAARRIASVTGLSMGQIGDRSVRAPLKPINLSSLAGEPTSDSEQLEATHAS